MADTDVQLWISFVSILAAFNITKAKDENGKDVEVDGEYSDTGVVASVPFLIWKYQLLTLPFLSHKKPFKCSILPRSRISRRLILQAVEQDKFAI